MTYSKFLHFLLLAVWFNTSNSFVVSAKNTCTSIRQSSPETSASSSDPPANVVDKNTFVTAIETVKAEIAKASGSESETKTSEENNEQPSYTYAIGKTKAILPIQAASGLDLAEAESTMVLVTGVSKEVAEAGIQAFDTIVGISAAGETLTFRESTNGLDLEATAAVFTTAVNHALDNGKVEIELELNRLIKLNFAEE